MQQPVISIALVEEALAAAWHRLSFPPELERLFQAYSPHERIHAIRLTAFVGFTLFLVFLGSDAALIPDIFEFAVMARVVVVAMGACLVVVFIRPSVPVAIREAVSPFMGLVAVGLVLLLFDRTHSPDRAAYLDGLVVIVMYFNLCLSAPFRYLLASSALMMAIVVTVILQSGIPAAVSNSQILIVFCTVILTLITAFRLERQARGTYLRRLRESIKHAEDSTRAMAETSNQLRREAESDRLATLSSFSAAFDGRMHHAVENVSVVASSICAEAAQADRVAAIADRESTHAAALASDAAAVTDTVATAAKGLVASMGSVQRQSSQASAAAADAVGRVLQSHAALALLDESTRRIETVVGLIGSIAKQTKLLSLNATIEAARAGTKGSGFGVVASEVKRLATQTSVATSDVASIVAGMQGAMAEMVRVSSAVQHSVSAAHALTLGIAKAMVEQSIATAAIAQNAINVAEGTRNTSTRTSGAADHVRQTATSARAMLGGATDLEQNARVLQTEARGFIAQLRSV